VEPGPGLVEEVPSGIQEAPAEQYDVGGAVMLQDHEPPPGRATQRYRPAMLTPASGRGRLLLVETGRTSMSETQPVSDSPEMPDSHFVLDAKTASEPQPIYRMLRENSPILRTDDGGTVISRHEDVEFALRHSDLFSSDMDAISIGNVRPLIPLQIDPPEHVKYRRLLDPLFPPQQGGLLETDVPQLTNPLIADFPHPRE